MTATLPLDIVDQLTPGGLRPPKGRAGIVLDARKEKSGDPYTVAIGDRHRKVLRALANARGRGLPPHDGLTDRELTFSIGQHMAAARRCELRDIGAVQRGDRRNGAYTWKITDIGRELLVRLESEASK